MKEVTNESAEHNLIDKFCIKYFSEFLDYYLEHNQDKGKMYSYIESAKQGNDKEFKEVYDSLKNKEDIDYNKSQDNEILADDVLNHIRCWFNNDLKKIIKDFEKIIETKKSKAVTPKGKEHLKYLKILVSDDIKNKNITPEALEKLNDCKFIPASYVKILYLYSQIIQEDKELEFQDLALEIKGRINKYQSTLDLKDLSKEEELHENKILDSQSWSKRIQKNTQEEGIGGFPR